MNRQLYYKLYFLKNRILPNKVYSAEKLEIKKRSNFYSQFIQKGDLVFDIGANMGNRVASFVALGARIIAVEPQRDCCTFLKERFGNKITVVGKGVGDREDILDFYVADSNILSTFSKERIDQLKPGRFAEHSWQKAEKIAVTTLDNLIELYGVPSFIKIDVEGMEPEVLRGLSQKVKWISFEFTVPEETDKLLNCMEQVWTIDENAEFNYSPGETMELALQEWLRFEQMAVFIRSRKFVNASWGDIYVRNTI